MFVSNYNLTHLFSYTATVRLPPEVIGPVPEGIRGHDKSSSQVSGISEHKGNDVDRRVFRALSGVGSCG
jgi:hypothetical protein